MLRRARYGEVASTTESQSLCGYFEMVEGSPLPLVTNAAGNRKLIAATLGVKVGEMPMPAASAARNISRSRWLIARRGRR